VPECVSRVAGFLRDQRALARVTVALDLEVGLPPVRADAHALDQVLVNLFLNAAQAMPGGGTIQVSAHLTTLDRAIGRGPRRATDEDRALMPRNAVRRIGAWRDGPMPDAFIELIVADSGPGIPDDDLERVFDPFFTTKAPGEGTGLGLAIVSRVVEDAGGIVFARRAREGGAAFVVLLPAVVDHARPARRALAYGSVA